VVSLIGYSNPLRTGPYRKFHDLVVNAYGEMMRNGVLATDRRPDRTARITTREVIEKIDVWRARYATAQR
jgi:heptosyltransferase I